MRIVAASSSDNQELKPQNVSGSSGVHAVAARDESGFGAPETNSECADEANGLTCN